jgi:hypothetical protein
MGLFGKFRGPTTDARDRAVLEQLRAAGANLARPAHTLFYLYASSEAGARRMAASGADAVLSAEVRPSASGDSAWLCLLQGVLVPSEQAIAAYRSRFEALAAAEGGEYDGWEAAVVE